MLRKTTIAAVSAGAVLAISLAVPLASAAGAGQQPWGQNPCQRDGLLTAAKAWDRKHFEGTPKYFCVPEPCTGTYDDTETAVANLGWIGWNNRISSVQTYHRCDVKFWDGKDYSGGHSTWIDQKGDLSLVGGGWNNRATSLKIS